MNSCLRILIYDFYLWCTEQLNTYVHTIICSTTIMSNVINVLTSKYFDYVDRLGISSDGYFSVWVCLVHLYTSYFELGINTPLQVNS